MFISVIYSRSLTVGSYVIRAFDRGFCDFSHVGIITEDGKSVIESTYESGVTITDIDKFKERSSSYEIGLFPAFDIDQAYDLAYSELSKDYDLCGAIGLGIPFIGRDWGDSNQWFCSELLAYCSQLFPKENSKFIGVSACYKLTRVNNPF